MTTNESGRSHPAAKTEPVAPIVGPESDPASADWRADAEDAALRLAAAAVPFGPDDVRALGVAEPAHPNRWGSLFSTLHGAGYIRPAAYVTSGRPARHSGLQRLWVGTVPDATGAALDGVRDALTEDRRRAVRGRLDALQAVADVAPLPVLACVLAALLDLDEALDTLGGRHA